MDRGTQAKVEATAVAGAITVIYAVLQAIVPIIQQSYPGFQWLPVLLMLMATLGAIVPLTSKWLHEPSPNEQATADTIAALSAVVTATAPSIAVTPNVPITTNQVQARPIPPQEELLPPMVKPPTT